MSETLQLGVDDETDNYTVYESADGETVVGMYVANEPAEQLGDYAEVVLEADGGVEVTLDKTTTNYGVYSSEGGAISGMYVHRDTVDPDDAESLTVQMSASDEDAYDEAVEDAGPDEEEINSLVV